MREGEKEKNWKRKGERDNIEKVSRWVWVIENEQHFFWKEKGK